MGVKGGRGGGGGAGKDLPCIYSIYQSPINPKIRKKNIQYRESYLKSKIR